MTLIEMTVLALFLFVGSFVGHAVAGLWGAIVGAPLGIAALFALGWWLNRSNDDRRGRKGAGTE